MMIARNQRRRYMTVLTAPRCSTASFARSEEQFDRFMEVADGSDDRPNEPELQPEISKEPTSLRENTIEILLVEDDADYAAMVKSVLETTESDPYTRKITRLLRDVPRTSAPSRATWSVKAVDCLVAALLELSRSSYDCVVLDLMLPDAELLRGLNAIVNYVPSTPVVVLSSIDDDQIVRTAISQGARDFVSKRTMDIDALRGSIVYAIMRQPIASGDSFELLSPEAQIHDL